MTHKIKVQFETIDCNSLISDLHSKNAKDAGAFVYFTGMVRDFIGADGTKQAAKSLRLEYYPGMCEKEIAKICDQAKSKWDVHDIIVIHRVGDLLVGEPIVFIGIASTHRLNAFRACEFIIDNLKTKAPFWKQEQLLNGKKFWVEQQLSDYQKTETWGH